MSAAHDSHGHDDSGDHHADAFDPEPARELGEGEPHTPPWLPVLGIGALLVGAVWFLSSDASPSSTQAASATSSAAAGAPPAAKAPPALRTAVARAPAGSAAAAPPQDPAERAKLLEAMKKKKLDFAAEKMKGLPKP